MKMVVPSVVSPCVHCCELLRNEYVDFLSGKKSAKIESFEV